MNIGKKIAVIAGVALATASAMAVPFTVTDAGINPQGSPVSATATFTITGANTVQVTLQNNQADPTAINQGISGVSFSTTGLTGSWALTSSSGDLIDIFNKTTAYTDIGTGSLTHWGFIGATYLSTLTGGPPTQSILGNPGAGNIYDNANPSITGDNPSVLYVGTFNLTFTGTGTLTDSSFTDAVIHFNTDGETLGGVPDGGATALLLGAALTGIGLIRRKLS